MEVPLFKAIEDKPRSKERLLKALLSCNVPVHIPATVTILPEPSIVCNNGHKFWVGWIGEPKIVLTGAELKINSDQCPACLEFKQYELPERSSSTFKNNGKRSKGGRR